MNKEREVSRKYKREEEEYSPPQIKVSMKDGVVSCIPEKQYVDPEETITWYSEHPFAIHFISNSPVQGIAFRSEKKEDGKHSIESVVIRAGRGMTARYCVACSDGELVDIDDPVIIYPRTGPRG